MPVTTMIRRSPLRETGGFRQLGATPHFDYATYLALRSAVRSSTSRAPSRCGASMVGPERAQLAGIGLKGTDLGLAFALAACARSSRADLPSERAIRAWTDAFGRRL